MAPGINYSKEKKKPWKTRVERDIIMHKDIKEVGLQVGKVIGENYPYFHLLLAHHC